MKAVPMAFNLTGMGGGEGPLKILKKPVDRILAVSYFARASRAVNRQNSRLPLGFLREKLRGSGFLSFCICVSDWTNDFYAPK